jgi:magnesium transporter
MSQPILFDTAARTTQIELLRLSLLGDDLAQAFEIYRGLHLADQALVYDALDSALQRRLLAGLDVDEIAHLFDELDDPKTLEAAEGLPVVQLAEILDEMEPDEAADLLGDLPAELASQAIEIMEESEDIVPLLGYPDETAGGRMTTAFLALRRRTTVDGALAFMREVPTETYFSNYLLVVDGAQRLAGLVAIRDLVAAQPTTTMAELMTPDVFFVTTHTDQEEAARTMARYDLSGIPVVDESQRLVGIITHDDVIDVLDEEATEDIYALANVSDSHLEPESGVAVQLRGRLPWLMLSTLTALLSAWVISRFEATIAEVAVLAVFQSIVAGLGGNAVTQNMTLIVRAIALGRIPRTRVVPVVLRQAWIGLLVGLVVGSSVGLAVFFWKGNATLAIILGLALFGNMIVAGLAGTLVPISLGRLGLDPAVASSVLVTTVTDSLGFLFFLGLATLYLSQL